MDFDTLAHKIWPSYLFVESNHSHVSAINSACVLVFAVLVESCTPLDAMHFINDEGRQMVMEIESHWKLEVRVPGSITTLRSFSNTCSTYYKH